MGKSLTLLCMHILQKCRESKLIPILVLGSSNTEAILVQGDSYMIETIEL